MQDDLPTPEQARIIYREIVETILLATLMFLLVNSLTGRFHIEGPSMQPGLHEGEYVIVNRLAYAELFGTHPQRGEVIVFRSPTGEARDLIKRVIGLPGETVRITDGTVNICPPNNACFQLTEPYIAQGNRAFSSGEWQLNANQYFVMGDNRINSSDSRTWGGLDTDLIIGKAMMIYWPRENWGGVGHHAFDK